MKKATQLDKKLVTDILTRSFDANKSVNYIVKQDNKRARRMQALMDYSFEVCNLFGEVFISDDMKACALVLYPDKKRTSLKTILLEMKLILQCIGLENIKKVLQREEKIRHIKPKTNMAYIWFIGVDPDHHHTGIGSKMLEGLISKSKEMGRPVYLETSTLKNLPWYERFGFQIYGELDLGYKMFFLKHDGRRKENN